MPVYFLPYLNAQRGDALQSLLTAIYCNAENTHRVCGTPWFLTGLEPSSVTGCYWTVLCAATLIKRYELQMTESKRPLLCVCAHGLLFARAEWFIILQTMWKDVGWYWKTDLKSVFDIWSRFKARKSVHSLFETLEKVHCIFTIFGRVRSEWPSSTQVESRW